MNAAVEPSIRFAADAGVTHDASGAVTAWANAGTLGKAVTLNPKGDVTFAAEAFGGRGGLVSAATTDLGLAFNGGAWYCVFRPSATGKTSDRVNMGVFGLAPDGMRRTGLFYVFDNGLGKTLQGALMGENRNSPAASDGPMVVRASQAVGTPLKYATE